MTDDDAPYEVLALESAVPNDDGTYFKFTFMLKGGPSLSLAIPSQCLFPLERIPVIWNHIRHV